MKHSDTKAEQILKQLIASTRSPRGQFSAAESYKQLQQRLPATRRYLLPLRTLSAAAAVALLCVLGWVAYQYATPPAMHTVATLAERKSVQLPDGSVVLLNHFSSLTYPEKFRSSTREVSLHGEAYFEVSHDKQHPFIVQAEAISVQVLGTRFNVEAYPDNPNIQTTLLEGSVAVSDREGNERIVLQPNETAIYNKEKGRLVHEEVSDIRPLVSWQRGEFIFQNEPLQEIARELSNSFGIPIRIESEALRQYRFTARFADGESLTYILDLLQEQAGCFEYTQKNKQVTIQEINQ